MNSGIPFSRFLQLCTHATLPLILLFLPVTTGCLRQAATSEFAATETTGEPSAPAESESEDNAAPELPEISYAAINISPDEIMVPANLRPSGPAADIIKLINAGAEVPLMMAFVTNSTSTFNLRAEEIVYLSDIGVPPRVLTAILQHDHVLRIQPVETLETEPLIADANPVEQSPENETAIPINSEGQTLANPELGQISNPPAISAINYPPESPAPIYNESPAVVDFHDALSPYGSWVEVDGYGSCWQPAVVRANHSWAPYFDRGRWVDSDCGWYWMSDYSWGWAAFHYGRWFQHARLGWCWTPDRVWGPSWVCWRSTDQYCGWAPLPPGAHCGSDGELRFHGVSVKPNFHFNLAADVFHFVPTGRLADSHPQSHAVPRERIADVFHHATPSTSFTHSHGMVANTGLPTQRVGAAHRAGAPVALHTVDSSAIQNTRERFEGNGRTLAIQRLPDTKPSRALTIQPIESVRPNEAPVAVPVHYEHKPAAMPLQAAVNRNNHELELARMDGALNRHPTFIPTALRAESAGQPAIQLPAMKLSAPALQTVPSHSTADLARLQSARGPERIRLPATPEQFERQRHSLSAENRNATHQQIPQASGRPLVEPIRTARGDARWWIPTGGEQQTPALNSPSNPARPTHHEISGPEPAHNLNLGHSGHFGQSARADSTPAITPHSALAAPAPAAPPTHVPSISSSPASATTGGHDHQTSTDTHAKGK